MLHKETRRIIYVLVCLCMLANISVSQTIPGHLEPEPEPKPGPATTLKDNPDKPVDWGDKDNWTRGVPLDGEAIIDKHGIAQIREDAPRNHEKYHPEFIDVVIGKSDEGLVHHIRGSMNFNSINMGTGRKSYGEYILSGNATLSTTKVVVGESGGAFFNQEGGRHTISETLTIGEEKTSSGVYALSDLGYLKTSKIVVGEKGQGLFDQTGGKLETGYLVAGYSGKGEYRLGGRSVLCADKVEIGIKNKGVFNQTSGRAEINQLIIHNRGTYNLKGGEIKVAAMSIASKGILDIFSLEAVNLRFKGNKVKKLKSLIRTGNIYVGPCEYKILYVKKADITVLYKAAYKFPESKAENVRHVTMTPGKYNKRVEDIPKNVIVDHISDRNTIENSLIVEGGYNLLHKGQLITSKASYIGPQEESFEGQGARFNNSQGEHDSGIMLQIGAQSHYDLGGEGKLHADCIEYIGGNFSHSRGINQVNGAMVVGPESPAMYRMSGKSLLSLRNAFYINTRSRFDHATGKCEVKGTIFMRGTYNLCANAKLIADSIILPSPPITCSKIFENPRNKKSDPDDTPRFVQTGGTVTTKSLKISGTYLMKRGTLITMNLEINGILEVDMRAIESFKMPGKHTKRLNEYIESGRIRDPSLYGQRLRAVYRKGTTYLVLEPAKKLEQGRLKNWFLLKNKPDYWHDNLSDGRYKKWRDDTSNQSVRIDKDGYIVITKPYTSRKKVNTRILDLQFGSPDCSHVLQESTFTLHTREVYLGYKSKDRGSYLLRKGGLAIEADLYLGYNTKTDVEFLVENTGRLHCQTSMYNGYKGKGILHQSGGEIRIDGNLYMGIEKNSYGEFNLHEGTVHIKNVCYVGQDSSAVFNQNGGTNKIDIALFLNAVEDGGVYNLNGGRIDIGQTLGVGLQKSATFRQTGGMVKVGILTYIGRLEPVDNKKEKGRIASYLLADKSKLITPILMIGINGPGDFRQTDGNIFITDSMHILGNKSDSYYELNASGKLRVQYHQYVGGESGNATFRQDGGTNKPGVLCILPNGKYHFTKGSLETEHIEIFQGGVLDLDFSEISTFVVRGNKAALLNNYIHNGRIIDSTMDTKGLITAIYDSELDQTTLTWSNRAIQRIKMTLASEAKSKPPGKRNTRESVELDTAAVGPGARWRSSSSWSSTIPTEKYTAIIENAVMMQIAGSKACCRELLVGVWGPGSVLHEKYDLKCDKLVIGDKSAGDYTQKNNSSLTARTEIIGRAGNGQYQQSGGTNSTQSMFIGLCPDFEALYELSDEAELHVRDTLHIGLDGIAEFKQSGGTNTVTGALYLNSGFYRLSKSGKLIVANHLCLANGEFVMEGGSCETGVLLQIEKKYTMKGESPHTNAKTIIINKGTLLQQAGSVTAEVFIIRTGRYIIEKGSFNAKALSLLGTIFIEPGNNPTFALEGFQVDYLEKLIRDKKIQSTGILTVRYDEKNCRTIITAEPGENPEPQKSKPQTPQEEPEKTPSQPSQPQSSQPEIAKKTKTNILHVNAVVHHSQGDKEVEQIVITYKGILNISGGSIEAKEISIAGTGKLIINIGQASLFIKGNQVSLLKNYIDNNQIVDIHGRNIIAIYDEKRGATCIILGPNEESTPRVAPDNEKD